MYPWIFRSAPEAHRALFAALSQQEKQFLLKTTKQDATR